MSSAKTTEIFNCSLEDFWKVISDYENYPQFLQEVSECKVVGDQGNKKLVEYSINLIKKFKYRLWMDESQAPNKLTWELEGGDIFKVSKGYWELEAKGEKTSATYSVEAQFKVFVPGPVAKALVSVNLPNMMKAYHQRLAQVYGIDA